MAKVTGVPGSMESIISLENKDLSNGWYRDALEIFQWLLKNREPKSMVESAEEGFRKFFVKSFESFFAEMGLSFGDPGHHYRGIYLRIDGYPAPFINVCFRGVKIIPGRDNVLDGLNPEIDFFVNPDQPAEIKAKCKFEVDGYYIISFLLDLVPLCYLTEKERIFIRPGESSSRGTYIFAPLNKFGSLCCKLKSLVELVSTKELEKLCSLKRKIKDAIGVGVSELDKAWIEGVFARALLETLEVKF
jgi:hypothetical protein